MICEFLGNGVGVVDVFHVLGCYLRHFVIGHRRFGTARWSLNVGNQPHSEGIKYPKLCKTSKHPIFLVQNYVGTGFVSQKLLPKHTHKYTPRHNIKETFL